MKWASLFIMITLCSIMLPDAGWAQSHHISDDSDDVIHYRHMLPALTLHDSTHVFKGNDLKDKRPRHTYKDKRQHNLNLALDLYCGGFDGYEQINGIDKPLSGFFKQLNTAGITTPIGVSITLGNLYNRRQRNFSFSVFISVFDPGVISALRYSNGNTLKNAAVSESPNIALKNLVTPGGYVSVGIPRCPLSLNAGLQGGLNPRNVVIPGATGNSSSFWNNSYIRYSISLCMNIPLFNIYTSAK